MMVGSKYKSDVKRKNKNMSLFKIIRWLVKVFYIKMEVEGVENLSDNASIVIGNHTQMNGPIACELYFPGKSYTWCIGEMMHLKSVPKYAYQDFWSQKPKVLRPMYRVAAYLIAPLASYLMSSAKTIGVYKDGGIISTFKKTVKALEEDANVVIFPEYDKQYNHILYDFKRRFVDVAKLYYKKTGKELNFVPMYIAPKLKKMYLSKPIRFDASNNIEDERERICQYLIDEITRMATELPEHIVIPYRNIPKRLYNTNKI